MTLRHFTPKRHAGRRMPDPLVVVRELLAQYTRQYEENPVFGLLRNWTSSISDRLRTSILAIGSDKISNLTFFLKAVSFRERVLQRGLAARLYHKVMTEKDEFFSAWNSCLHHVVTLALAHIHRVTLEKFAFAVESCPVPEDQSLLMEFCLLYGTKLIYNERAWYLEHKYLTPAASNQIREQLLKLCRLVKDDALKVISAFNIPRDTIHAPIAGIPNPRAQWAYYPQPKEDNPRKISAKL
ncbi:hypothetical protein GDO78_009787 [Eleutherodactylus coqui]|uniref:Acyl-CoA oxidase C-terminal domain-containing protein n=1 Tax=Eleutherodactylus coqui TaxID=57060 RepID=A0A8J6K9Y8_ELECQ|nr:hypothetical protein GDO78_009787 [Eleutherodactylus coqui]